MREEFDLPIVTEAIDHESLQLVDKYADCIQIGARNMQNFSLLKSAGRARKPVLLKRGMSATLEELLLSAEYIMAEGNYNVILCERGVRTFADHTRNTLDLSIVPAVKRISHLPILVDPSHGTGKRNKVAADVARRDRRRRRRRARSKSITSRKKRSPTARRRCCRRRSSSSSAKSTRSRGWWAGRCSLRWQWAKRTKPVFASVYQVTRGREPDGPRHSLYVA